ncbi:kinase-like protein [Tothia fuscella]|uniref:Kinase-like protein n=1 Tax=Tothia fuscella TaxID=1048955 RepID=A0A9P4NQT5_9PEZI|nr:kinase-like protein [Tothia fuscella]
MTSDHKPSQTSADEQKAGILPADHFSLTLPAERPPAITSMSAPSYQSPLRHHTKAPSGTRRHVKETLNAKSEYRNSEDDGSAEHRINQYLIKNEIGRGSFGAVHIAVDQYGNEYAVKEFSKSRLRKRAQSNLLRRPNAGRVRANVTAGKGFNSPLHRHESGKDNNSLDLIREEIAIMKKLYHHNVVSLIEVLDDPQEDSLYMVMEMCKKGVVMKVGLGESADPYDEERCRLWFRDMILGIEYLHAQGILHRDIKPDNCLITDDDILKFVDFGVSEMFQKDSAMNTAKSAGSPAFMPPELCVARHGEVSGKAADIWSMGATLYCLRYGRIPFEKTGMLELYDAIKHDDFELGEDCSEKFKDLMRKLLEKDPQKRIRIEALREHPWVTRGGMDPLLPRDDNITEIIEPPTEEELQNAITGNMGSLLVVMKAAKKFKRLLVKKRPEFMEGIFGRASRIVQPPLSMLGRSKSMDVSDRKPVEAALTAEGVHRVIHINDSLERVQEQTELSEPSKPARWAQQFGFMSSKSNEESSAPEVETDSARTPKAEPAEKLVKNGKGHAHDPLEDILILGIGTGELDAIPDGMQIVSESPGAVDINVYEKAYQEEIDRITKEQGDTNPTLFLTRRVERIKEIRDNEHITDYLRTKGSEGSRLGFAKLMDQAKAKMGEGTNLAELVRAKLEDSSGGGARAGKDAGSGNAAKTTE